jgi:FAD/FMN-containing dehydrogenase
MRNKLERRNFIGKILGFATFMTLAPIKSVMASVRALDILELSQRASIITPEHRLFSSLTKVYNLFNKPQDPDAIVRSSKTDDYSNTIKFAQEKSTENSEGLPEHLKIRMRCGGHSYEYFSMGKGIVCDVRNFKRIKVNNDGTANLGAGLLLSEVIKGLGSQGYGIPVGSCPSVGLSGLTLGGGLGLKGRTWGLACDRVLGMNVILANGDQVTVTPDNEHSDLYWAMLGGGGGNFGLVTDFHFELEKKVDEILYSLNFNESDFPEVMEIFEQELCLDIDNLSSILTMSISNNGSLNIRLSGTFNDYNGEASAKAMQNHLYRVTRARFSRLFQLATRKSFTKRSSDSVKASGADPIAFKAKSHYSENGLGSRDKYEYIIETLKKHALIGQYNTGLIMGALGGKYDRPDRSNAYPHRNCRFSVEYYRNWRNRNLNEQYRVQGHDIFQDLESIMDKKAYVNYPDYDLGDDWAERYYGENLQKILDIKKKYDPNLVFDFGRHSLASLLK